MDKISEKIKAARIAKGVTIEEVAEATLLSVNIIRDIEDGAFERFVGDELYVKMYLKKIARYLEIDETIADDYYAITREIKKADLKTIDDKKEFLLNNNIAVWDVIASCEIEGSSDSSIKNVVVNDLNKIIDTCDIKQIFCNGGKSFELYKKYCEKNTNLKAIKLPSTSPANARFSLEKLINEWQIIKNFLYQ